MNRWICNGIRTNVLHTRFSAGSCHIGTYHNCECWPMRTHNMIGIFFLVCELWNLCFWGCEEAYLARYLRRLDLARCSRDTWVLASLSKPTPQGCVVSPAGARPTSHQSSSFRDEYVSSPNHPITDRLPHKTAWRRGCARALTRCLRIVGNR